MDTKLNIVDFKTAKLLKKKGFDNIECKGYYHVNKLYIKGYAFWYSNVNKQEKEAILAPEQHQVVDWLLEKHGIWVYVNEEFRPYIIKDRKNLIYKGELYKVVDGIHSKTYSYDTPQEAYAAAFDYILSNKII